MLKRVNSLVLLFVLLITSLPLAARSLDTNLGSDSVRITYAHPVDSSDYGRKEYTIGALYNKDDNFFIDASLQIIDEAGSKFPGLEVGIGPKAYFGSTKTQDYLTFGFEALGNYRLANLNRFVFSGYGYYSPNIVSFGDAEEMWELHARAAYELIPSASI